MTVKTGQPQVGVLGGLWTTHEVCSYTFRKVWFARTQALKECTAYHLASPLRCTGQALHQLGSRWDQTPQHPSLAPVYLPSTSSCPVCCSPLVRDLPAAWLLPHLQSLASPLLFGSGAWCRSETCPAASSCPGLHSTSGYTCSWTQLPQVLPDLCPKASACVWEGLLFAQEKDTKNLYDHKHLLVDFQKLLPVLQHVYS